jgi:hypothetical protein
MIFYFFSRCLLKSIYFFFFLSNYRAYDRAAIKFRGVNADINFSLEDYEEDMKQVISLYTCFFIYL